MEIFWFDHALREISVIWLFGICDSLSCLEVITL